MTGHSELSRRRAITFEEAEGIMPLPSQLRLREMSQEFRSILWAYLHDAISVASDGEILRASLWVVSPWRELLFTYHVNRLYRPADEFNARWENQKQIIKNLIWKGDYSVVLGFLQFIVRHPKCPYRFPESISEILEATRMAYRLASDTIIPLGSEQEAETISRAMESLSEDHPGAQKHLRNAAQACTEGNYSGCIRESIHAVESVARVLNPGARSLSSALATLEKSTKIHGGMRKGFEALYGFASDEQGIRHPLLDENLAKVDEADGLFMLGACSAFVTYLVTKGTT